MTSPASNLETLRGFACEVVRRLREAEFEALWAGGCVRDDLLGIEPKDYDVATTATPEQVIELFGRKKTIPVGVSFGVVIVLGPTKRSGQVEVATFRSDGEYHDGRRPSEVQFCSAKEDAQRRDFTINGMFYDPVTEQVIDYVGGQADLAAGVLRAIGDAHDRFTEDKLRILRAVRFASTYEFQLDADTEAAVRELRHLVGQVSVERISQELKRMLSHHTRAVSVQRLFNVGLMNVLFPTLYKAEQSGPDLTLEVCRTLDALELPAFEPALAVLLQAQFQQVGEDFRQRTAGVSKICRQLKLSNEECGTVSWILDAAHACVEPPSAPLHVIKPILADDRRDLLIDFLGALSVGQGHLPTAASFLRDYLHSTAIEVLNPPPMIDGGDLKQLGVEPGPEFKRVLTAIRNAQLDDQITTREDALTRARELLTSDEDESRAYRD